MNDKMWEDALSGVEQKYIDRAAKSFRTGRADMRVHIIDPSFIDPPKNLKQKSRARRFVTAAASIAAAVALTAGGLFAVSLIDKAVGVHGGGEGAASSLGASPARGYEDPVFTARSDARLIDYSCAYIAADPNGGGWYAVTDTESSDTRSIVSRFTEGGAVYVYSERLSSEERRLLDDDSAARLCFTKKGICRLLLTPSETHSGYFDGASVEFFDESFALTCRRRIACGDEPLMNAEISLNGRYLLLIYEKRLAVYDVENEVMLHKTPDFPRIALPYNGEENAFTLKRCLHGIVSNDGSRLLITADELPDEGAAEYKSAVILIDLSGSETKAELLDVSTHIKGAADNICSFYGSCLAYIDPNSYALYRYGIDGSKLRYFLDVRESESISAIAASPNGTFFCAALKDGETGEMWLQEFRYDNGDLTETRRSKREQDERFAVNDNGDIFLARGTKITLLPAAAEAPVSLFKDKGHEDIARAFGYIRSDNAAESFKPSTDENIGTGGCDSMGNYYTIAADGYYALAIRKTSPSGEQSFYIIDPNRELPEGFDDKACGFKFFVTKDGPAAIITPSIKKTGMISAYYAGWNDSLELTNISKIELPEDGFFGRYSAAVSYDGRFIIDAHFSVYMDSRNYIRIYQIGENGEPSALYREVSSIAELEYPRGADPLVIGDVLSCAMSGDGRTLITVSSRYKGADVGMQGMIYTQTELDTGSENVVVYDDGPQHVQIKAFDGGIAVMRLGIADIITQSSCEHYVFGDYKMSENSTYEISPNGRYILAQYVDESTGAFVSNVYDTAAVETVNEIAFLNTPATAVTEPVCSVSAVTDDGKPIGSSIYSGEERQEPSSTADTLAENRIFDFIFPVTDPTAQISVEFGPYVTNGAMHNGIDICTETGTGTQIVAAFDGIVSVAHDATDNDKGRYIVIWHEGGYETLYAHCSEIYVASGEKVKKGQVIAAMGATGFAANAILHFEMSKDGNPVDPLEYVGVQTGQM